MESVSPIKPCRLEWTQREGTPSNKRRKCEKDALLDVIREITFHDTLIFAAYSFNYHIIDLLFHS